jgi:glutathione synthase/RimK-type ligase-like ATP-grasp enzyme
MDEFWINLLELSEKIPMFPHPQDLLGSACKVQRDNDLMIAATSGTLTPYPRSMILANLKELLDQATNSGVVIKRDFSDSSDFTFLPGKKRSRTLESMFKETSKSYSKVKNLPYPSWLAQPYIPALVEKGEIRAFVVGGKLAYAIHTWPGTELDHPLHMEFVENYTPLELLK